MAHDRACPYPPRWLAAMRATMVRLVPAMLAWEILQLPLFTLWRDGTAREIAFAVLHCTAGDALIAMAALSWALLLVGSPQWPDRGFGRVAVATVAIGLAYTGYSEWLNVELRGSWAYAEAMPRLPVLGTGLAPLLQWALVPPLALIGARRALRSKAAST
jgi:hypothetical protein